MDPGLDEESRKTTRDPWHKTKEFSATGDNS